MMPYALCSCNLVMNFEFGIAYLSDWTICPIYILHSYSTFLKREIAVLQSIVSRKDSGRRLSFGATHIFKAFQILTGTAYVSRALFGRELHLGAGSVKTVLSHLRHAGLIDTVRSGTFLTESGRTLAESFLDVMPKDCIIAKSNLVRGLHSHAVLLRGYKAAIRAGLEQRDYAIMAGAQGAVTLICSGNSLLFPGEMRMAVLDDAATQMKERLGPSNHDAIIIATSDDPFVSEMAAKSSALQTIVSYES